MIKTPLLAASAVTLLMSATAMAGSSVLPAGSLPATHVVHALVVDGLDLRSLDVRHGAYAARIGTGSGEVVTVGIDPVTGEITDAFSSVPARRDESPAPGIDAAGAIMAVAGEGFWDIGRVELKGDAWRVEARNDSGQTGHFMVDAASGLAQTHREVAEF